MDKKMENFPLFDKYGYLLQTLDDRLDKEIELGTENAKELVERYNAERKKLIEEWKKESKDFVMSVVFDRIVSVADFYKGMTIKLYKISDKDRQMDFFIKTTLSADDATHILHVYMNTFVKNIIDMAEFNEWAIHNEIPIIILSPDKVATIYIGSVK